MHSAQVDAIGRQVHIAHIDGHRIASHHGFSFFVEDVQVLDARRASERKVEQVCHTALHQKVEVDDTLDVTQINALAQIGKQSLHVEPVDLEDHAVKLVLVVVVDHRLQRAALGEIQADAHRSIDVTQVDAGDEELEVIEAELAAHQRILVVDIAVVDIDVLDHQGQRFGTVVERKTFDDVREIEDRIALQDVHLEFVGLKFVEHIGAQEYARHIQMRLDLLGAQETRRVILLCNEQRIDTKASCEAVEPDGSYLYPASQQFGTVGIQVVTDIWAASERDDRRDQNDDAKDNGKNLQEFGHLSIELMIT